MANFEVHFPIGIASGILLAGAGLKAHQIQPIEAILVVALTAVGSCIPDIDHNDSKPYRYFCHFLTFVLPFIILLFLSPVIGSEHLINLLLYLVLFAVSYRYICPYIKTITKHRGVLHSIPFGLLCGELFYLFFVSEFEFFEAASKKMPVYFGAAIFIGHVSHLLTDEFYSLYDEEKKTYKKKYTYGSAFTMYSEKSTPQANIAVYILVVMATAAISSEGVSLQSLWLMIVNAY